MYHNITRRLMSIVGITVLFAMSISVLNAQNTINMTFSKYKDRDTGEQVYKAGDKVSISFTIPEGKEAKVEGAEETKAVDGKNEFTLVASENGNGVKPIIITGDITEISASYSEKITIETLKVESKVIESISIKYNDVENIICDNLPKLKLIEFPYDAILKQASFENCSSLEYIDFNGPSLTSKPLEGIKVINLKGCTALKEFTCTNRNLEKLDFSGMKNLERVSASNNELVTISLIGCEKLKSLDVKENKLESIDIQGCSSLSYISCYLNKLTMEASHKIAENLPQRTAEEKGLLSFVVPVGTTDIDLNVMSTTDVSLANSKNWTVQKVNQYGSDGQPYNGEAQTFNVTIEKTEHGKIEIEDYTTDDLEEVEEGAELIVKVTPDKGYKLDKLMANKEDITTSKRFTVNSNITLKATFVEDKGKEEPDPKPENQKYNFGGVIYDEGVSGFRYYYDSKDELARIDYIKNNSITSFDSVYYNDNHKMVRIDKFLDYSGSKNLVRDTRFDYEYDQVGNLVSRKASNIPTGMSFGEYVFKYDDEGHCIKGEINIQDVIMSEKFDYDEHGNMIKRSNYSRNSSEDESKDVLKAWIDYTYNNNNLIKTQLYIRTLSTQDPKEVPCSEQYDMSYDDKNCLAETKVSQVNKRNEMVTVGIMKYKYDEVLAEDINMPVFAYDLDAPYSNFNIHLNGMPLRRTSQGTYAPNKKTPASTGAYIYSYPASIKEIVSENQISVKVFPNPASDVITVDALDIKEVKLIDMNGQVVRNYPVHSDRIEIPVESLTRGMYIVNVKTSTQTESIKIILK